MIIVFKYFHYSCYFVIDLSKYMVLKLNFVIIHAFGDRSQEPSLKWKGQLNKIINQLSSLFQLYCLVLCIIGSTRSSWFSTGTNNFMIVIQLETLSWALFDNFFGIIYQQINNLSFKSLPLCLFSNNLLFWKFSLFSYPKFNVISLNVIQIFKFGFNILINFSTLFFVISKLRYFFLTFL